MGSTPSKGMVAQYVSRSEGSAPGLWGMSPLGHIQRGEDQFAEHGSVRAASQDKRLQ